MPKKLATTINRGKLIKQENESFTTTPQQPSTWTWMASLFQWSDLMIAAWKVSHFIPMEREIGAGSCKEYICNPLPE